VPVIEHSGITQPVIESLSIVQRIQEVILSLRIFVPCKLLAPYVTAIWDYDDLTGSANSALSILPDTATYLCFLYADLLQTTHKDAIYNLSSG